MEKDYKVTWLDADKIRKDIENAKVEDKPQVRAILAKGREMKGLTSAEVAVLMNIKNKDLVQEMFDTARFIKDEIYGKRIVFFAPLYFTNYCANECLYCAFRKSNKELVRHALSKEELIKETEILINQGHKRILMVAGESYPGGLDYVLDAIKTVYSVKSEKGSGEIRRLNVNLAPLSVADFRRLKDAEIGTFQLFQETYDRDVYAKMHIAGKKSDFDWRADAMDRAMEAGIEDVGLGVLFGLADWKFDLMALIRHTEHLEEKFGVGAHTISVPRIEPAHGSEFTTSPESLISDDDFKKIIAILRIAVPYTGLILSTRENAQMRREALAFGISQISAGSRTNPGGYASEEKFDESQFQLGDHRTLAEVVKDIAEQGYIPSFCTACYRLGRVGSDFMALAKTGQIKTRCAPNAVGTFAEFLIDYATPETRVLGEALIEREIAAMDEKEQHVARKIYEKVLSGKRDVYC